ncbi:hypothetical protein BCR33DRAFT_838673 [Rhizoclosmatium globosum]|uniref:G-protein coupled receptors family 3 profile domain-containing protein n=1 Tax=Rhizoclosmatium globosum TaxID=329046 RepID=A0A1Y2BFM4_9FUNG|nr:hypothetical protein BCR33DRAFT_838673 [Rhizoclosmatium globosum]|eukprot:ORY33614.1 hypothetical protein BCR33DRAFT_838673 [Rhizoclosmatium globosum]
MYQKWNVRQAAVIYEGSDVMSTTIAIQVATALEQNNIILLANFKINTGYTSNDFNRLKSSLQATNARYILLLTSQTLVTPLFLQLAQNNISVGPGYVWISRTPLDQSLLKTASQKYPSIFSTIKGFMVASFGQIPTPTMTDKYNNLQQRFNEYQKRWVTNLSFGPYMPRAYDIVMVMINGIHNVLANNPSLTVEMLQRRELQSMLNHTSFVNTGYRGVQADPCELTAEGDAALPFQIGYYTGNSMNNILEMITFGQTDLNGNNFEYLSGDVLNTTSSLFSSKPVFAGGGDSPPTDGYGANVISEDVVPSSSQKGIIILVLEILGLILCLGCAMFTILNRSKAAIKNGCPEFLLVILVGSLSAYGSVYFSLNRKTVVKCHAQQWLQILAVGFIATSFILKNVRLYIVFSAKQILDKKLLRITRYLLIFLATLSAPVILLLIWSLKGVPQVTKQFIDPFHFQYICVLTQQSFSWTNQTLQIYMALCGVGLAITGILTRDISAAYTESIVLIMNSLILLLLLVLGFLIPDSPFLHGLAVWFATTFTLVSVFGTKFLNVGADYVRMMVSASSLSSTSTPKRESAAVRLIDNDLENDRGQVSTNIRQSDSRRAGSRVDRFANDVMLAPNPSVTTRKSKVAKCTSFLNFKSRVVCRIRRSKWVLLDEPWWEAMVSLQKLRSRIVLTFNGLKHAVPSFIVTDNCCFKVFHAADRHVVVYEHNKVENIPSILVIIEFSEAIEADEFENWLNQSRQKLNVQEDQGRDSLF